MTATHQLTPSVRPSRAQRAKRTTSYTILALFSLIYIGPFLITIATSFKTDSEAVADPLSLVPDPFTLDAWKELFGIVDSQVDIRLGRWTVNSVFITLCVTAGRVGLAAMAGYALARLDFPGRRTIFAVILGVMMVPGVVLLIPRFLVLKELSLRNTYPGMILPLVIDCAAIYLMKQNFEQIPKSVEEAAAIDGANIFRTWRYVVLPMAKPGLIAITILSVQGAWNEFTMFLVATDDPQYKTLVLGLAQFRGGLGSGQSIPAVHGHDARRDDPDRHRVLHVPALLHRRRQQGRGEVASPSALGGWRQHADAEQVELRLGDRQGRVRHRVGAGLGLRERDHLADVLLAGEDRDQAVDPDGESAVRRRAEFERVEEETELAIGLLLVDAEQREDAPLLVALVDSDRTGPELPAVEHEVVGLRANAHRVALEPVHVVRMRLCERMVGWLRGARCPDRHRRTSGSRRPTDSGTDPPTPAGGRGRCAAARAPRTRRPTRRRR